MGPTLALSSSSSHLGHKASSMCCYLVMVGQLECLSDTVSYTGGCLSPWQVQPSQAGCRGEDRLKVAPGPPGWGLGVGLTTAPWNTRTCYQICNNTIHSPGTTERKKLRANMTVSFINCFYKIYY